VEASTYCYSFSYKRPSCWRPEIPGQLQHMAGYRQNSTCHLIGRNRGSTTNHSNRRPKHVSDTRQGNIPSRKSRLLSHESKSGCWAVLPQLRWSAVKQYISIKTSPATRAGQQRLANEFSRYEYGCYSLRRSSLAPNDWRPSAIARVAFTAVSGRGSMHPVDSVLRVVGD